MQPYGFKYILTCPLFWMLDSWIQLPKPHSPLYVQEGFKTNTLKIQHAMPSWSQKYTLANHPHLSKCQLHLSNRSGQNPWRHPWLRSQSHPIIQPLTTSTVHSIFEICPESIYFSPFYFCPRPLSPFFTKQPKWSFWKSNLSTLPLFKTFQQRLPYSKSQNPYGGLPRPHDPVLWPPLWPRLLVLSPHSCFSRATWALMVFFKNARQWPLKALYRGSSLPRYHMAHPPYLHTSLLKGSLFESLPLLFHNFEVSIRLSTKSKLCQRYYMGQ